VNSSTLGTDLITGASRSIDAVYADRLASRGYDQGKRPNFKSQAYWQPKGEIWIRKAWNRVQLSTVIWPLGSSLDVCNIVTTQVTT
jgi:hypothetical protein